MTGKKYELDLDNCLAEGLDWNRDLVILFPLVSILSHFLCIYYQLPAADILPSGYKRH